MRTRAGFQWGCLAVGLVMSLVSCGGKKLSEAPKEVVAASQPCGAAMKAMEVLRRQADSGDAKTAAPESGEQRVLAPAEVLRASHLLQREGPRCYEQRLAGMRAIESTNREQAAGDYESLRSFVASLRSFGVEIPAIDFAAKIADLRRNLADDAGAAYAAAEAARHARRCQEAIPFYQRSLDLVADYGEARQRIAECYYELAASATESRLYRQATQHFRMADQRQPDYRDSRTRAARIHLALGNYYLGRGYPRNAVLEYEAAESLVPDLPDVHSRLEAAKARAYERLAVRQVSNPTGNRIEGVAVEEFIADSLFEKLQKQKSQFLDVWARNQLDADLLESRGGSKGGMDQTKIREWGILRGVKYLVAGTITQVSQKQTGPVRARRETPVQGGARSQRVQYDEIAWSAEIAIAGSIELHDLRTGTILISRSFDKRENGGGRWVDDPRIPGTGSQITPEVQTLYRLASPEAMARRTLEDLTDEVVTAILEKIDRMPSVPDPTGPLAELQEPRPPLAVTPPPVIQATAGPSPKVEVAVRQQYVRVKGDSVNIRPEPSTQSQTLGRARKGEAFPLVSRQKDWVKIQMRDGREGWIAERLVEILEN